MAPFVQVVWPSAVDQANVIATNLQGHYTFDGATPLNDKSGNARHMSVITGTPPGANADGYELNINDRVGYQHGSAIYTSHAAFTIQVAYIPEGNDNFQNTFRLKRDGANQTMYVGYGVSGAGMGAGVLDDQGNLERVATGVEASGYTTTGVMLTARWNGVSGDLTVRINKGADSSVVETGDLTFDEVDSVASDVDGHTLVYAVWYDTVLSDTDCNANYDAIKAYVNSRPNVALA